MARRRLYSSDGACGDLHDTVNARQLTDAVRGGNESESVEEEEETAAAATEADEEAVAEVVVVEGDE